MINVNNRLLRILKPSFILLVIHYQNKGKRYDVLNRNTASFNLCANTESIGIILDCTKNLGTSWLSC